MELNEIKGAIEIDGFRFKGSQIIATLIEQGFSVSHKNGVLRIGQGFVEASDDEEDLKICPIIDNCKTYDKLMGLLKKKAKSPQHDKEIKKPSLSNRMSGLNLSGKKGEKMYLDEINFDETEIMEFDLDYATEDDGVGIFGDSNGKIKRMVGIGTPTYSGPAEKLSTCPFCGSPVDPSWIFCGKCGRKIRHG